MKMNFIRRSLPLVLLGVGLGLLARLILGAPETGEKVERKFDRPINETRIQSYESDSPDFELDKSLLE